MEQSQEEGLEPAPAWSIETGPGAIVAAAIHSGHDLRMEVARGMALSPTERLREEDPWTSEWTRIAPTRIVVRRSRFEVDLNRPREGSVYRTPEEAWGLNVWTEPPAADLLERSYAEYDGFYAHVRRVLDAVIARHGWVLVFDLHSYNHRRGGPDAEPDDPAANPDVNLGTGTMDRERWAPVVDAFLEATSRETLGGRPLDVRENVRFQGGWFSRWIHETYPGRACALAVEFKKIFMDEWTGVANRAHIDEIGAILERVESPVRRAMASHSCSAALRMASR
jgi:N-formylglutamate amidohydrolase